MIWQLVEQKYINLKEHDHDELNADFVAQLINVFLCFTFIDANLENTKIIPEHYFF